jgi:hypothetical protein
MGVAPVRGHANRLLARLIRPVEFIKRSRIRVDGAAPSPESGPDVSVASREPSIARLSRVVELHPAPTGPTDAQRLFGDRCGEPETGPMRPRRHRRQPNRQAG